LLTASFPYLTLVILSILPTHQVNSEGSTELDADDQLGEPRTAPELGSDVHRHTKNSPNETWVEYVTVSTRTALEKSIRVTLLFLMPPDMQLFSPPGDVKSFVGMQGAARLAASSQTRCRG
jgi:hypothetical protein